MIRTIGELIDALMNSPAPTGAEVFFELGFTRPTTIASWRGDYSMAALGYALYSRGAEDHPTVESLLTELNQSIEPGRTYEGWKGGDNQFTRDTPLWVDNYGDGGHSRISKVKYDGFAVWLRVKNREY